MNTGVVKTATALLGVGLLAMGSVANGAVSDEAFRQLQQKLDQALQRIEQLESDRQAPVATSAQAAKAPAAEQVVANTERLDSISWAERIAVKGDFRYRGQYDEVDGAGAADDTRDRNRIRARAALVAQLPSDIEIGLGVATGSDDPVSTNQTLGAGGSTKDINLDLAYFDWSGLTDTHVRGGKLKADFKIVGKSGLQWDSDWRPEGIDLAWDNGRFFAQALGSYLESDSNKDNDEFAYFLQAGTRAELGPVELLAGVGYTDIDAEGKPCFFEEGDDQQCFGNEATVVDDEVRYANDFEVYNVFAEASFDAFGQPMSVFGDYITNDAANDHDTGYLVGTQLGKAKKQGSWQVKYYYEKLESNATLGLLSNSDFGGGGTNGKGSVLSAAYALTNEAKLGLTYYMVERNSDNIMSINGGDDFDVDTVQVDVQFKYK